MNTAAPLPRWRRITIWVLIVLAGLIGLVSALTVWAKRQALETDKWVATSSRLLEDDEIRGALSLYLVDQLYANVDVAAELQASSSAGREAARGPDRRRPAGALGPRGRQPPQPPGGADALGGGEPPGARGLHPHRRRRG